MIAIYHSFMVQYHKIERRIMEKQHLKTITDESYREKLPNGNPDFPLHYYLENVWEFDFHCIAWHWHPELEFIYVRDGSVNCYVGTEKLVLSKGYGLFVNSGVLHRYEATDNNVFPNIVFSPNLFGETQGRIFTKYINPIINSGISFQILSPNIEWQNNVLNILLSIFELQNQNNPYEFETVTKLFELWNMFYKSIEIKSEAQPKSREMLHRSQLQIMMQYIHTNYGENIKLDDIAATVYISKNNALQIFRKGINMSPIVYLIQYRLARAAELLLSTDKTVASIAMETGFDNVGYFCRKFKAQYCMSAKEYRFNRK